MISRLVILAGLLALLVGVAAAGAQSRHRQLSSNLVDNGSYVVEIRPGQTLCQQPEIVPEGTSGIRLTLGTHGVPGPPLVVRVTADGHNAVAGRIRPGWAQGSVVLPVARVGERLDGAEVCVRNAGRSGVAAAGVPLAAGTGAKLSGEPSGTAVRIEYTTAEPTAWWSMLGTIASRVDDVRAAVPGSATLWLWIGLLAAVVAAVGAILLLRLPRAGRVVTLVALVNALAWGLIVPPWHVPDETAHFYYAEYLGRTGEAPVARPDVEWYSLRMVDLLTLMRFPQVIGHPDNRAPWTDADRAALVAKERSNLDDVGDGHASTATSNSPVYYALQAAVSKASASADMLDRLAYMRVLSAVISALTVACIFGFLREVMPGSPWSATVGALAAALQPMFGFISSGVNNDGLLYLCSALLLFGLARAFRRGLTPRRAALIGGVLAFGTLVKAQLIAFLPAVLLAFALLSVPPPRMRIAWRPLAAGAAAAIAPLAVYLVLGKTIWDRPVIDRVGAVVAGTGPEAKPELTGMASYVWQAYLPRLPFLQDWFAGFALKNLWVEGLLGRFGWLDYAFPRWVLTLGTAALALVAAAAAVTLVRCRGALRARAGEAIVYLTAAACFAGAVAAAGYLNRLSSGGQVFEQARYLLPLLPLYALAVALATRALGRRGAYVIGSVIVLAALTHTVFAQLLTLTRYYG